VDAEEDVIRRLLAHRPAEQVFVQDMNGVGRLSLRVPSVNTQARTRSFHFTMRVITVQ